MNGLDILLRQLSVEKFINLYGSKAEYSIIALVNTSKLKKKRTYWFFYWFYYPQLKLIKYRAIQFYENVWVIPNQQKLELEFTT